MVIHLNQVKRKGGKDGKRRKSTKSSKKRKRLEYIVLIADPLIVVVGGIAALSDESLLLTGKSSSR